MEFRNPEIRNYGIMEFGAAKLWSCVVGINVNHGPKSLNGLFCSVFVCFPGRNFTLVIKLEYL